jgi:ABC-type multidrug transport system ATPase subunit
MSEHGGEQRDVETGFPGIEARELIKRLKGRMVLDRLNLVVAKGEVAVVEGANGAGKTTLIRVLSTVITPDKGSVSVNGYDVRKQPRQVRQSVGVAFVNDRSLYWRLDAPSNLRVFGRLMGLSKEEIERSSNILVERLHLGPISRQRVATMSTGQRQRVMLARAFLANPSVLLLDEPLRGLDEPGTRCVLDLVAERASAGSTVLITAPVTTDLSPVADRLYTMDAGSIAPSSRLPDRRPGSVVAGPMVTLPSTMARTE